MKTRIAAAALIAALSQSALADNGGYWSNVDAGFTALLATKRSAPLPTGDYWAGIQASFDNMLDHVPYAGPTGVTVARGEPDPAEALIHAMVRGEREASYAQERGAYFDNVAASFDRMQEHAPHAGPTGVTALRTLDHRVDRLIFALRLEQAPSMKVSAAQRGTIVK